jgi:hypothetical protein
MFLKLKLRKEEEKKRRTWQLMHREKNIVTRGYQSKIKFFKLTFACLGTSMGILPNAINGRLLNYLT